MAQRRMFARDIVGSDSFIELPLTAQALYLHLTMEADDDGIISSARKTARSIGATSDDLTALIAAGFLLDLGDNILVVKHWRMNNYIQNDRYKPSVYVEKMAMLYIKPNKAYTLNADEGEPVLSYPQAVENPIDAVNDNDYVVDCGNNENSEMLEDENPESLENKDFQDIDTSCIQNVSEMYTQVSIDKVSIDKLSIDKANLAKPNISLGKKGYGRYSNVYLSDDELNALKASFVYPEALLYQVSCYLKRAPARPKEKTNHYALCEKIGLEDHFKRREAIP